MLTGLTTAQLVLIGVAVLIGLVWIGKDAGSIKDSILKLIGKVKDGDISGAIITTLQNSDVFIGYQELKGEAKNVIAYAKTKHDADNIPEIVDQADVEAVRAAYSTILQAIAKATTDVQPAAASRRT